MAGLRQLRHMQGVPDWVHLAKCKQGYFHFWIVITTSQSLLLRRILEVQNISHMADTSAVRVQPGYIAQGDDEY